MKRLRRTFKKKQPLWKRTPEKNNSSLKELNKYPGKPYALLKGKKKKRHQDNLQKRYKLRKKKN